MPLLSAQDAAEQLGVSRRRVLYLIKAKRIRARLVASAYVIDTRDLDAFAAKPRPNGRPATK